MLKLDCAQIESSFALQTEEIYAGQYPCLPKTANGTRTLLRFATVLDNLFNESIRVSPYSTPLRIAYQFNSSSTVLRAGYLNVTCLRDTQCTGRMLYWTCSIGGLASGCNMSLDRRLPCQWVDITGLLINMPYTMKLWLIPGLGGVGASVIDPTPCQFSVVPGNFDYLTVGGWRMLLASFIAFTGMPVVFIIASCIVHDLQKTPAFHVKYNQMYRTLHDKYQ